MASLKELPCCPSCLGDTNGPATVGGTGSWRDCNLAAAEGFGMFTCPPAFRDGSSLESSSDEKQGVGLLILCLE